MTVSYLEYRITLILALHMFIKSIFFVYISVTFMSYDGYDNIHIVSVINNGKHDGRSIVEHSKQIPDLLRSYIT